jgi:hypothetical protein
MDVVGMKEINQILAVTDRMGLSREWVEIPLGTESPGGVSKLPNGKLRIVVDSEHPLEEFIGGLEAEIRRVTGR